MKTKFFYLMFLSVFIFTEVIHSQWIWQNPSLTQGNRLQCIKFIDETTGWAVGYEGIILKTTDGGNNWIAQISGTKNWLYSTYFTSLTTGWIAGSYGKILKTTDGGNTWITQNSGTYDWLYSVAFTSSTTGWIVGDNGKILKTTDGGTSWITQASGTIDHLYSVHFTSSTTGWIVGGNGKILKTTDEGITWISQTSSTTLDLRSVYFTSATAGWAVGGSINANNNRWESIILKTIDGGMTWDIKLNEPYNYGLRSVYFSSSTVGWAVGWTYNILKTTNGGNSWISQATDIWYESVYFTSSTTGWAVGFYGTILKTIDGGNNWIPQGSITTQYLRGVYFISSTTGWVVGHNGTIIKTTDGGSNWVKISSGTTYFLFSVHFIDSNIGWTVGWDGVILKTTDGGNSWVTQPSGVISTFLSVYFISSTTGWTVGSDGIILKTTNGGTSWITQTSGTSDYLNSVHFASSTTGWAVGENGIILKTIDGGDSWITQTSGTSDHLNSVHFASSTTGWAVGIYGKILKTTNGGTSWITQTSGTINWLYSIYFISSTMGWTVGSNGTILKTTDGGSNWSTQSIGVETFPGLSSVHFFSETTGWTVGSGGVILKSSPGTPVIFLNPTILSFGQVQVGQTSNKTFRVTNTGIAALEVSSITSSNPTIFSANPTSATIQPSQYVDITVTFAPTQVTAYNATITIVHNAAGSPSTVSVSGEGSSQPVPGINVNPTSLAFGQVQVSQTSDKTFNITNTGNAALEVSSITSSNPTVFAINPTSATIQPGNSQDITVTFAPNQVTTYNGTITIEHNTSGSPSTVSVSGTGIEDINYPDIINVNTSYSFGDFTQTSSYKIIGIPGDDDLPISDFMPGSSGKENNWRAFRDPGSGNYIEYPNGTFNFGKGRAFWILSKQAFSVSETVGTGTLNGITYSIDIHDGWNIISNPFQKNIPWSNVQTQNGATESIHFYQTGSYSESSQFEYYKGYYFYNSTGLDSLKIPYVSPGEGPLQKQQIDISKQLELELVMEGERRTGISIGFSEKAKIGVDELDKFSPPSNFCEVNLALYNEGLETNYKYLKEEYRAEIGEGQEFEIKLKNTTGKSIELTAEGIENFTEYELYLLDKRLNKLYNLREQNIVEVKRTVKDGDYSLLVGTESYILDKKSNLLPENYVLYQNYPNPFNPVTTIRFSIPKDEIITLSVYNILGELVKEVIKTQQYEAGYYEVELDGSSLSSGIYIYKLEADSFVETKKMVLLR